VTFSLNAQQLSTGSISMKAAQPKIGVLRQEFWGSLAAGKEEEGRIPNKCFYKYEMLPDDRGGGDRHPGYWWNAWGKDRTTFWL